MLSNKGLGVDREVKGFVSTVEKKVAKDGNCPARGRKCSNSGKCGHYASCYKEGRIPKFGKNKYHLTTGRKTSESRKSRSGQSCRGIVGTLRYLSHNKIEALPEGIFQNLPELWGLDLSVNKIEAPSGVIFQNLSSL
ncbi:hypothetical protein ACROYT_G021137 [Oculina patagonica]